MAVLVNVLGKDQLRELLRAKVSCTAVVQAAALDDESYALATAGMSCALVAEQLLCKAFACLRSRRFIQSHGWRYLRLAWAVVRTWRSA